MLDQILIATKHRSAATKIKQLFSINAPTAPVHFDSGVTLGVVGIALHVAAGIQDVISGWLIDSKAYVAADGVRHYDFHAVAIFWFFASIISFLLPLFNKKM